jgi:serine/threonine protein kinase
MDQLLFGDHQWSLNPNELYSGEHEHMVRLYDPKEKIQGYTIEELISTGNNAVSYAARSATGEKVFFKLYQSPSIRVPWYRPFVQHQRELKERIERGSCRQFCYRFLGGFEHDRKYHQVFEYLDKSHSLAQILDRVKLNPAAVPWEQRELMAKVLVAGIDQLHVARIVHADLKPENVMLIEDHSIAMKYRLKIIDMDFSFFTDKKAPWDGHEGYFGTPGYMSPEHVSRQVPQPASDVFTLGLMLYQLLAQGHPYVFDDIEQYPLAYRSYTAPRPKLLGKPREPATTEFIEEMLYRCLHPDPSQRPTAHDLHRALTGEGTHAYLAHLNKLGRPVEASSTVSGPAELQHQSDIECSNETSIAREDKPHVSGESLRISGRLKLVSSEGIELTIGASLKVGRIVLARFGHGAQYAADHQFTLERVNDQWFLEPGPNTPNDTLLNGELLNGRRQLIAGDRIAIGRASSQRRVLELEVKAE